MKRNICIKTFAFLLCIGFSSSFLSSCREPVEPRLDFTVFQDEEPLEVVRQSKESPYSIDYKLWMYQECDDFTTCYPNAEFTRKKFEVFDKYDSFGFSKLYKNYLYFHTIDKEKVNRVIRYNMQDDTTETIFTYDGPNQVAIEDINDEYIVWKEDENANWFKVSLNYYDIAKAESTKIFTYPRDENGYMNHWDFDNIVLNDDCIYFDNTEGYEDGKANINFYEYNISEGTLTVIDEKRAAEPLTYKTLSWLNYDDEAEEYLLKNIDGSKPIALGSEYIPLISSENILVGRNRREGGRYGIVYFDGKKSYPVIQQYSIAMSLMNCTDEYITWYSDRNDVPFFYDIRKKKIICVNSLQEQDVKTGYVGYVNNDYLVFSCSKHIPEQYRNDDYTEPIAVVYYFVKTSNLK